MDVGVALRCDWALQPFRKSDQFIELLKTAATWRAA